MGAGGLEEADLAGLLQQFQRTEQTVVSGESLCRRLPYQHTLAARLLARAATPPKPPPTTAAPAPPTAAAAQHGSGVPKGWPGHPSAASQGADWNAQLPQGALAAEEQEWGVELSSAEERRCVAGLLERDPHGATPSTHAELAGAIAVDAGGSHGRSWPPAVHAETVLQCGAQDDGATAGLTSRSFVRTLGGEMRLASVIVSEA